MKRLLVLIVATLIMQSTGIAEPSQFLCVVEHAAGLHYDHETRSWLAKQFGSKSYVLRKLTEHDRDKSNPPSYILALDPQATWAFFNAASVIATCREPSALGETNFFCRPSIAQAEFDPDSRRFEVIYHGAYVGQAFWEQFKRERPERFYAGLPKKETIDPEHPDDLFIEIGKCSPS